MRQLMWAMAAVLLTAFAGRGYAHETDPYTLPAGRDFADLGDYFTQWAYDAIDRGVSKTNEKIRQAIEAGHAPGVIEKLQSTRTVTMAVNREFPNAYNLIEGLEHSLYAKHMQEQYPGKVLAAKQTLANSYLGIYLPVDPRQLFRLWNASTIKAFGVYFGTDKVGHFTDMGKNYYKAYQDALDSGATKDDAIAAALHLGTDDLVFSESGVLGYLSAGQYSNADLAANYLGFLFYRNLTEPVMLKGEILPPMLVRQGDYWAISPRVQRGSDFFSWFISDHLDEALNPGHFEAVLRNGLTKAIRSRGENILWRYRDVHGCRRSPAWFEDRLLELETYHGQDYGHSGKNGELLCVGQVVYEQFPQDAPVDARNTTGYTPLHMAVLIGSPSLVHDVLARGADVNAPVASDEQWSADWGSTPLHLAARDGRVEVARLLIAAGADVNAVNDRGVTPLHKAAGDAEMTQLLVNHWAVIDAMDKQGRTPLHWAAAMQGDVSVLPLLQRGARINARDHQGNTPLHEAVRTGEPAVASMLLSDGANATAANMLGITPLHLAAARHNPELAQALLRSDTNANVRDAFGRTPMHDAARHGNDAVIKMLLSHGAAPDTADTYGTTPLALACRYNHESAGAMLLGAGANVHARNVSGETPLHEAAFAGNVVLTERLLRAGADPTARNGSGGWPEGIARSRGFEKVATRLYAARMSNVAGP